VPKGRRFSGLPTSHTFIVHSQTARVTTDRATDAEGRVAVQFLDGVPRVELSEVRFWPWDQSYPGGRKRWR